MPKRVEEGVLRAGQLPEVAASASGNKLLFEAFESSVSAAPKKKPKKEDGEAKPACER